LTEHAVTHGDPFVGGAPGRMLVITASASRMASRASVVRMILKVAPNCSASAWHKPPIRSSFAPSKSISQTSSSLSAAVRLTSEGMRRGVRTLPPPMMVSFMRILLVCFALV
jgi:hypothetical protein